MKKRVVMMLVATMALTCLIGCGNKDNDEKTEKTTSVKAAKHEKEEPEETSDIYALYEQYLEKEAPFVLEDYEQGEYGFYDVDEDGVDELIMREPSCLYIIKDIDDELVNVYPDGEYSDLLENGMIRYFRSGSAPENENYAFYELIDDEYFEAVSLAWYDNEEVGDGTYGEEDDYEIDGEEVTMEEWLETLDEYLYYDEADIEFQSISGKELPEFSDEEAEDFIEKCQDAGIYFSSQEEIDSAIEERMEELDAEGLENGEYIEQYSVNY